MVNCSFGECAYGRQVVEGAGPRPSSILLVGEAPGANEVKEGRPFIGRAGKLLDTLLMEAGLKRADIRITNSCCCVDMGREDKRPLPAELDACSPRLDAEIMLTEPRVILCVGNTSIKRWFPGLRIGEVYNSMRAVDGYVVIPTYHPAHVLRGNAQVRPVIVDALKMARRLM